MAEDPQEIERREIDVEELKTIINDCVEDKLEHLNAGIKKPNYSLWFKVPAGIIVGVFVADWLFVTHFVVNDDGQLKWFIDQNYKASLSMLMIQALISIFAIAGIIGINKNKGNNENDENF